VELAIRFLGPRRRFEREVRNHLSRHGFRGLEIETALERLKELELVSDLETARAFLRDRRSFSPKGRGLLRSELLRRGVDEETAEAVLDEALPAEEELESAVEVLRRSRTRLAGLSIAVARRRMWSALSRRGYDPETAREAISRFVEESGLDAREEGW
jgi:regulatory protein